MDDTCRMYRDKYPSVGDLIMVEVISIDTYVNVRLLEYGDIEGTIVFDEMSNSRLRGSEKNLSRIGKQEVVIVLAVDEDKGYIDLSKKKVPTGNDCKDNYNKSRAVHIIHQQICAKSGIGMETLYEMLGWKLYDEYDHAYDVFKDCVEHDDYRVIEELLRSATGGGDRLQRATGGGDRLQRATGGGDRLQRATGGGDPRADIYKICIDILGSHFTKVQCCIRAVFEIVCFTEKGIEAIKNALLTGIKNIKDTRIIYSGPPEYIIETGSYNKEEGEKRIYGILERIKKEIMKDGGLLCIKILPYDVSQKEHGRTTGESVLNGLYRVPTVPIAHTEHVPETHRTYAPSEHTPEDIEHMTDKELWNLWHFDIDNFWFSRTAGHS